LRGVRREHAATWLSREDVPPRSVGGRKIVLTCRECNSTSGGHLLDAELRRRETLLDFARGTMRKPASVVVEFGGVPFRATLLATGDNVEILGDRRRNDPAIQSPLREVLDRAVDEGIVGWSFRIGFEEGYRQRESLVGWLRAGYLVAFAALGYRYILDQALDCVREQIRTPKVTVIRSFSVAVPKAPQRDRLLVLLQEPAEIRSVIVRMGAHMIFLPEPETGELGFYQRIEEGLARLGGRAQCKGQRIPWPSRPVFALDFLRADPNEVDAPKRHE
jgi:hypothetical protein